MLTFLAAALVFMGYVEERDAIIADAHIGTELTELEQMADSIFEELKNDADSLQKPWQPWASQYFPLVRDDYAGARLFQFLQEMPKGAVLHVHPSAMGDYFYLFDLVSTREDCYFHPGFGAFSIFDTLPDSTWLRLPDLFAETADSTALRDSLISFIVFDEADFFLPDRWREFESIFGRVHGLLYNMEVASDYYYDALYRYAAIENVRHIELRAHRPVPEEVDFFLQLADSLTDQGYPLTIRFMACDSRYLRAGETVEEFDERIVNSLKSAADLMYQYPGIVVGGDIYSEEDNGATAFYMAPLMEEVREYSRETYGFELPLFLHDGESSFPTGRSDSPMSDTGPYPGLVNNNVIDAYLLGAERVGHGIELAKLPHLTELYAEAGIPLEICPVSNQVLGYVADLRDHPAITLMRAGVRISINPDDPAIFGASGVTHDWIAAVLAWDLSLAEVKRLVMNSIEDAAMTDDEKALLMERWQTDWDRFILQVVEDAAAESVPLPEAA